MPLQRALRRRSTPHVCSPAAACLAGAGITVCLVVAACGANEAQVLERGAALYAEHCAACHGAHLEGQPDWRRRRPDGRLPAPPHDESGHTWHHPDAVLFAITKDGMVPPHAPPGYQSDMPGFGDKLSDAEIRAVLAFIASHWQSPQVRGFRAQLRRNATR